MSGDGFLVEGTYYVVSSLELYLISEGSTMSSSRFWRVYGFNMVWGSLSAMCSSMAPVSLNNWCGVSGYWCLLALGWAWFWCWDGGHWEDVSIINVPWCQEFSSSSKVLGLSLSPQGFRLDAYWSSRPHKPHSTKDKLPILLVKATLSSPAHQWGLHQRPSNISRKVSGSVVRDIGWLQSIIWPYYSL